MTHFAMVKECLEYIDEMSESQASFIQDLFHHCSEGEESFIDETTGPQRDWLIRIWEFYCNGNEDAFNDEDGLL